MSGKGIPSIEALGDELLADDETAALVAAGVTMGANGLRGEVDLILDGTRLVLRPSHEAIVEVEKLTRMSCLKLAQRAADAEMTLSEAALVVVELARAWGRATGDQVAQNLDAERVGQLLHTFGLMGVMLRLALVLQNAVTGGVNVDGTPKEGEAPPTTEKAPEIPVVGSQA
ncbi:MAG TPA: GTA-gp10 family protein [Allosphingosinicella sp.]|nr:GTA-gp10 family protein [Allosphingosinicella sp.]